MSAELDNLTNDVAAIEQSVADAVSELTLISGELAAATNNNDGQALAALANRLETVTTNLNNAVAASKASDPNSGNDTVDNGSGNDTISGGAA